MAASKCPTAAPTRSQVVATDASKNPVTATVQSLGTVSSVSVESGAATFDVDGISVPLSQLVKVSFEQQFRQLDALPGVPP